MTLLASVLLTAAATAGAAQAEPSRPQVVTAEARATIVRAVVVRQASGVQEDRDGPAPQISRRGGTILVEFQ